MSRGFVAAVGLLIILLGGALLAMAGTLWFLGEESEKWPRVPAVVIESRIETAHDPEEVAYRFPVIRFRYEVGGEFLENAGISLAEGRFEEDEVELLMMKYPVGAEVEVSVPPGQPGGAVLEPGIPGNLWLPFAFGIIAALSGVVTLVVAFRL